ncbi:MAG: glycosyltransferase family 2 protein [Gemmatimonadetes bacterium]|uniref:Glycosyltransferase family 2 protein n=1 Tax=Candidatus Kutchimonas denitrificans TaxID=3056748 RepID=A0AAE4Z7V0_9BACT|nr:glycosyltransferase family 2 protein [Gemmatimonadota bacterium]NIR73776.1 glycosyltransferase family 2 protein [Candidatus Kutchimonas denitrificans]NIS03140.1 glycosyltransferase family 2 protein [Gemmatimonadota bacterium]NIT69041.1 glycosyltransferase family 2 protein [Gemmatimonadota bacterium]NIU54132.1 glycosyltransferase [Gemmatimonadota bacterium]
MGNALTETSSSPTAACELTILLPCLNEAETIGTCIQKARGYLESRNIAGEVLVADNGSTDGSQEIACRLGARVVDVSERGYGAALMGGIAAARGRYVIMGDADDSYDFSDLDPFVEKLRASYELVMGNRFLGGIAAGAMPPLHRYLGNPVLSWFGRLFFKSPVKDFHCGLRGFSREAIQRLGLTTTGMEFASEMVVKATLQKLRITEVPTTLSPDGRSTPPHLRTWRDGWRHLRFLLLFSPRWLFLYPGLILMTVGLASMLWLLPGPRRIGSIGLDVNTLVYSGAAIIVGFQAVAFAVFAKIFAMNARLLPEDSRFRWLIKFFSLEVGIVVGLALALGGLVASGYAVGFWGRYSFGALDPRVSLRIVAPAATALMLGLQIVFASFFINVLGLPQKRASSPGST